MTESTRPAEQRDILTFLFVDARGYTTFTQEQGDEAAARLAQRFADLAGPEVEERGGRVVELRGDEVLAVFRSPRQALRAAAGLQRRFATERAANPAGILPVGIGLDAGEAVPVGPGYRGGALNLAARLCSLAGPGEILATDIVTHLARKIEGIEYVERGMVPIKGLSAPVHVLEVREAVPARTDDEAREALSHGARPAATGRAASHPGPSLPVAGFLGALPEGRLVAREAELQWLLAAAETVNTRAGQCVMLAGEPGIGKTRLAQEATLHLRQQGYVVAVGRCYQSRVAVPYYPFLDALPVLVEACPPALRAEIGRRWPYLGVLVPDLGLVMPSPDREEQERLFRAIAGLVAALAKEQPVALLLDDLHWADSSSLELVQHLVRATRPDRVLVAGTYRDVGLAPEHPLRRVLFDLVRERLVEQLTIERLGPDGTRELAAELLGEDAVAPDLAGLVYRYTEGNAFFIREMLLTWMQAGVVQRRRGRWERRADAEIAMPDNVRAIVAQRLSHLGDQPQTILREASVLGQAFLFSDLEAMGEAAGKDGEDAIELALEEGTRAGLVRETGADGYVFTHALIQQALYADLPARRRRRLHLAAAAALQGAAESRRQGLVAEIAGHYLAGGDQTQAIQFARLAGDRAVSLFAHAEAKQQYQTVVRLVEEQGDRALEAEVREKLGGVLATMAEYGAALAMLERAARLYRVVGDLEGEGRVTAQIGLVHHRQGTPREGIARLRESLASQEEAQGSAIAARVFFSLHLALANLLMLNSEYADGLATAERLAEVARSLADPGLLAQAEVYRGDALWVLGRQDDGLHVVREAVRLAGEASDIDTLALALDVEADILLVRGELISSRQARERALALFQKQNDPAKVAYGMAVIGWVLFYLGDWREARRRGETALELARAHGPSRVTAYPLIGLGMLCLAEGNGDQAMYLLGESVTICEQTGSPEPLTYAQGLLAECDLLRDDPEAARLRLERFLGHPGIARGHIPLLLATLAEVYLALGDPDQADEVALQAHHLAVEGSSRLALVDILRVQGNLRAQQRCWTEADELLQAARELAHDLPYPYGEARALYAHGQVAVGADPEHARTLLSGALAIFRSLGARTWDERSAVALTALDRGLVRRTKN